jgi:hypothetical protein
MNGPFRVNNSKKQAIKNNFENSQTSSKFVKQSQSSVQAAGLLKENSS